MGETKAVTSITGRPLFESASTNAIFASVGTKRSSFWRPSRGPTSTTVTFRDSATAAMASTDLDERVPHGDHLAGRPEDPGDCPVARRANLMLHLHRLEQEERRPLRHLVSFL